MKKILFTDLDGTLLKDDKTVSEKNCEAIRRMLDAGHYVVVATGRPVKSGFEVVKRLGLTMPGCYMIAFNGAVIYDCSADCTLAERTVPIEYVEYLFAEAKEYGIHAQTYSKTHLIAQSQDEELEFYVRTTRMPYKITDNIFASLESEPNKVLLASLDEPEKLIRFQKDHREWEKGRCNSFFSCREYLEYCPKNTDKGSGIRFLCEFLNVKPENTYAVGDERNDIPMIQAAGTGIAMINGVSEAKEAADYITEYDNEHDAIAEVIDRFILV